MSGSYESDESRGASTNRSKKCHAKMLKKKNGKLALELPRRKFFHAKYFPEIPLDLKKLSVNFF